MTTDVTSLARRLIGVAALGLVVAVAAAASASAAPGASLTITATGLPSGQQPSILLTGPRLRRVVTTGHVALHGLRPGRYLLTVRPVVVKRSSHAVRSGATVFPAKRRLGVTLIAGQAARAVAAYGAIINLGVRSLPGGLLGIIGSAENPSALVLSSRIRPPGVGTILTSGPTALLPAGLISKVTRTAHQHGRLVVSLTSVPITDAVPEMSFEGALQLTPAHGAAQEAGSSIPAQAASAPHARRASACGVSPSSSLLQVGAHLDSVELRQASLSVFPAQVKMTLAVRTTETLGLGILSASLDCTWPLAEIGPFTTAIPVGPLLIPVYATLPLQVTLSLKGTVQAGSINVASTTVAHVAAGFHENAASLSEQGTNVWATGPSVAGSAALSATIGVQAGIGIAKAGNVHVEAAFGPEFDAATGQGCDLHINLGSLSAGAEVFGQSLDTPAFTPFKLHLWSGCKSTGVGGGGSGGAGGGGSGSGGSGPGGGGGEPTPKEGGGSSAGHEAMLSAGFFDSCAATASKVAYCWGENGAGQLGDGTQETRLKPVAVNGMTDAVAISAGWDHSCALLSTGTVSCWGAVLKEDGESTVALAPVAVTGITDALAITAGAYHTCALLAGGTVDCWGSNSNEQLGDGTSETRPTPVAVSGITDAIGISAGSVHTCALLAGGTVDCWGYNGFGQLGNGAWGQINGRDASSSIPVPVGGLTDAIAISAGGYHTCALLADGTIDCWGENAFGQLGDGSRNVGPTPVAVDGIDTAVAVSAGFYHTCALLADGSVDCWGDGAFGELGSGAYESSLIPVAVRGITGVVAVSAGNAHTCASVASGALDCWGYNANGQVGDGTTTNSDVPVAVSGLLW